jgi:hypothetical protein
MLTKKNILLQQAATVRAARKLKQGKVLSYLNHQEGGLFKEKDDPKGCSKGHPSASGQLHESSAEQKDIYYSRHSVLDSKTQCSSL